MKSKAALALVLAIGADVFAQTAPGSSRPLTEERKDEPLRMETFTVTGTNIRRLDEEKILPVTVLTTADLDLIGASTPSEILDTLSIGGPIVLDEGNTLGADARGD